MLRSPDELRELVEPYLAELAFAPELGTLEDFDWLVGARLKP